MSRTKVTRSMAAVAVLALGWGLAVGSAADAMTDGTFLDHFASESFNGDDGDLPWSGPWVEVGETDGVFDGAVRVKARIGCDGFCLEMGTFTGSDGIGVQRSADLTGSETAILGFDYRRVMKSGGGEIVLSVSRTGTAPWTQLASFPFTMSDGEAVHTEIDIGSHIGSGTTIRWMISGDEIRSRISIDNVAIVVAGDSAATTTTVPVTTTTVPVTTTTVPVTTTGAMTTTTEPGGPGTSTTTTTTTTVPAPSTTTTQPGVVTNVETPTGSSEEPPTGTPSPRPAGTRPTEGLMLAGPAPGPAGPDRDDAGSGFTGTPLTRVGAAFVTGVESLAAPPIAFAVLAIVVAWLSVKGLERSSRQQAGPARRRPRLRR